jgi:hypothetical protein
VMKSELLEGALSILRTIPSGKKSDLSCYKALSIYSELSRRSVISCFQFPRSALSILTTVRQSNNSRLKHPESALSILRITSSRPHGCVPTLYQTATRPPKVTGPGLAYVRVGVERFARSRNSRSLIAWIIPIRIPRGHRPLSRVTVWQDGQCCAKSLDQSFHSFIASITSDGCNCWM